MENNFVLSYDISFDDYLEYNKTISELTVPHNRKKTLAQGIVIVVLALFLVVYNLAFSDKSWFFTIVGVIMFFVGLYITFFYKIFAPQMLKKSVEKAFESDKEGFNNRVVTFTDSYFTDKPDGGYGEIKWEELASVLETKTQILLLFPDQRGTILPKEKIDVSPVRDFLKSKMTELNREYLEI